MSFSDKIESAQYNAAPVVLNKVRGTSPSYNEQGLEASRFPRWFKGTFYKLKTQGLLNYLHDLIPPAVSS